MTLMYFKSVIESIAKLCFCYDVDAQRILLNCHKMVGFPLAL